MLYDPLRTSFEALARLFFAIHDPTQMNRQGPDVGDQYRSEIFYAKLVAELKQKGWPVVTRITPAGAFWPAEQYHQDYYRRNGRRPYCHRPESRFSRGP